MWTSFKKLQRYIIDVYPLCNSASKSPFCNELSRAKLSVCDCTNLLLAASLTISTRNIVSCGPTHADIQHHTSIIRSYTWKRPLGKSIITDLWESQSVTGHCHSTLQNIKWNWVSWKCFIVAIYRGLVMQADFLVRLDRISKWRLEGT